jgi:hypothetical protein
MQRPRWQILFAVTVVSLALGSCLHFIHMTWQVDEHGFSTMSGRLPYWDFSNLWAGGRLAAEGNVLHLFDLEQYRAGLRRLLSPYIDSQEWSYPPSILMLGLPLGTLPILPAYIIWTACTALLFLLSLRLLILPWWACLAVATSPAALVNVALGQNGALTAALLVTGLSLSQKRPILAGILFGLLTVKPQIGILVPVCLLASRNYRAIASATATTLLLFLATGFVFGFESWRLFWSETRPLMTSILEAPYPQDYQGNAVSFFVMARWMGLNVAASYIFQGVFSALAMLATAWLWSRNDRMDPALRTCATALLTTAASPYGYTYDALVISAACALLFLSHRRPSVIILAIGWIYAPLNQSIPISVGVLVPTLILLCLLGHASRTPANAVQGEAA